jgi:hypothetical protein
MCSSRLLCSTATIATAADGVPEATGMAGTAGTTMAPHCAKQKVVYHITYCGAEKRADALRNIQNHINAAGVESALFRAPADWTGDGTWQTLRASRWCRLP